MKNKGFTLIESLIALTISFWAITAFIDLINKEAKNDAKKEFEYDFKKIINAYEKKIIYDFAIGDEYWTEDNYFDEDSYEKYLKNNFISKDSKCSDKGFIKFDNDYIGCNHFINYKLFDVTISGKHTMNKNDFFQYQTFNFHLDKKENVNKLIELKKTLKKVMVSSEMYSQINFMIDNNAVDLKMCLEANYDCHLNMTFGSSINYLHDKNTLISLDPIKMLNYGSSLDGFFDVEDTDVNDPENSDMSKTIETSFNGKSLFISKKDIERMKSSLQMIQSDPDILENADGKIRRYCSQYEDADYYFMSKHDQDHVCFKFKNK